MAKEQEINKKWEKLTIQNNFVFGKAMESNPDLCRRLLEKILRIRIKEISYPEREKVVDMRLDSKGIRIDVYVEEKGKNRSFDIEMQVANNDVLEDRMRYYQGLIDMDKLQRGEKKYKKLGESYIIFICPFDYLKDKRHIYTIREKCEENPTLKWKNKVTKIILNAYGEKDDVSANVKAFLDYVAGQFVNNELVKELDETVRQVKTSEKWRKEYMTFELALQEREERGEERGFKKGHKEGKQEAYLQSIRNLMKSMNMTAEEAMKVLKISKTEQKKIFSSLRLLDS